MVNGDIQERMELILNMKIKNHSGDMTDEIYERYCIESCSEVISQETGIMQNITSKYIKEKIKERSIK